MSATVLHMSDWRGVFVLPGDAGTVAFLAARGKVPKIAHEQTFEALSDALTYAGQLSTRFGCSIIAPTVAATSGEDAA